MTDATTRGERMQWFREARFGMFVHWGMYSVLGRGEQVMQRDLIPASEYDPLAEDFVPADDWAERLAQLAVDAGAKYVVLTTRHHDGYCLFNTSTHDFNAADTGPGRDLIEEYVEALRDAGLKVGFYYSLMNWHWHGYWDPKGYPGDLNAMVEEVHTQVEELMTHYGEIDILWFDGGGVPGSSGHGMWGGDPIDKSPAEFWRADALNAMIRDLQPNILVNNRAGLAGDFGTPEQHIRAEEGGRAWETCMTLNYAPGWGYLQHSLANKTPNEVLFNMVDAVRLGGNFLFNVGPRGDGMVDDREKDVLLQIGEWMDTHGEAIYGTQPEKIYRQGGGRVQGPMFHYGMWTCKGRTAYFTMFYYPGEELVVSKVGPEIVSAELLTTGKKLDLEPLRNGRTLISGLPPHPPGLLAPVVKVEFKGTPHAVHPSGASWLDGEAG